MRRFVWISLAAPVIVALVVLVRPWLIDMRGKPSRTNYPFDQIRSEMKEKLPNLKKSLIYAEDKYLGGNLKLFFTIRPSLPLHSRISRMN